MFENFFKIKQKKESVEETPTVESAPTTFPFETGRIYIRVKFDDSSLDFSKSFCGSVTDIDETKTCYVETAASQYIKYITRQKESGFFRKDISENKSKLIPWHRMHEIEITEENWTLTGKYEKVIFANNIKY